MLPPRSFISADDFVVGGWITLFLPGARCCCGWRGVLVGGVAGCDLVAGGRFL